MVSYKFWSLAAHKADSDDSDKTGQIGWLVMLRLNA